MSKVFARGCDYWPPISADPFQNDETFVTCVLLLEEIGAAGNKVYSTLIFDPVILPP